MSMRIPLEALKQQLLSLSGVSPDLCEDFCRSKDAVLQPQPQSAGWTTFSPNPKVSPVESYLASDCYILILVLMGEG